MSKLTSKFCFSGSVNDDETKSPMGAFDNSETIENDETGGQGRSKLVDFGIKNDRSINLNLQNNS